MRRAPTAVPEMLSRGARARLAASLLALLGACGARPLPASDGGSDVSLLGDAGDAGDDRGPPRFDWGISVGAPPSSSVAGWTQTAGVVAADDGGAVVAGRFGGTVAFAPDKTLVADDAGAGFVARYRSDQRLVWVRPLSVQGGMVVVADMAAIGGGEVAVVGWYTGTLTVPRSDGMQMLSSAGGTDLFVARVAADGSVRWAIRAGGPGDEIARAVATRLDATRGVTIGVAGAVGAGAVFEASPPVTTTATDGPIYVATFDGDGALGWVRFAGGGVPGQAYGLAVDGATGDVAVTGYVNGPALFGRDPSGAAVTIDPAVGRAYLARWSAAGALAWAKPLAGPKGEGDALAADAAGDLVATGLFQGNAQFGSGAGVVTLTADAADAPGAYLAAFSRGGELRWARRLAGMGLRPWRLRGTSGGALLMAGWFGGGVLIDPDGPHPTIRHTIGGNDALFARLEADGSLVWALAGGGLGDDEGSDLAAADDGTLWTVGSYVGPATFTVAGTSVTLSSGTDGAGFLLRLGL